MPRRSASEVAARWRSMNGRLSYLFRFGRSGRCVNAEPASALAWAGVAFPPFRRTAEAIRPTFLPVFSPFGIWPLLSALDRAAESTGESPRHSPRRPGRARVPGAASCYLAALALKCRFSRCRSSSHPLLSFTAGRSTTAFIKPQDSGSNKRRVGNLCKSKSTNHLFLRLARERCLP